MALGPRRRRRARRRGLRGRRGAPGAGRSAGPRGGLGRRRRRQRRAEVARGARARAPLCLGVLERVLRLLLGDDESGDESDDSEAPDAPAPAPDAVLGCRDAVRDAADAALGFCGEARLQRDAAARGLPEAPAPAALELLLSLCRPCLSLLGLLAAELDEDETGDDDGDGDGLALHARLAELRPGARRRGGDDFVDDLVEGRRARRARRRRHHRWAARLAPLTIEAPDAPGGVGRLLLTSRPAVLEPSWDLTDDELVLARLFVDDLVAGGGFLRLVMSSAPSSPNGRHDRTALGRIQDAALVDRGTGERHRQAQAHICFRAPRRPTTRSMSTPTRWTWHQ